MSPEPLATRDPVLIVGCGLLGGSIGLSLRTRGLQVQISDVSPSAQALGSDLGVGEVRNEYSASPQTVIIATPPDVAAGEVLRSLRKYPTAVVIDVSSVKSAVITEVLSAQVAADRYCSVHPMAGRENSGVAQAQADLFRSRPWVVVAHDGSSPQSVLAARTLGVDLGAITLQMNAEEHDRAVALISHAPQLLSSLLAAQLLSAPEGALSLVGQGLRDMTRIANSDPRLWTAILAGNAGPVYEVLAAFRNDLDVLLSGLQRGIGSGTNKSTEYAQGLLGTVNEALYRGNQGSARIPGKHGAGVSKYGTVTVLVPDKPGYLGKLFSDAGAAGVNIEDFRMEHSLGQPQGLAVLSVLPVQVEVLSAYLLAQKWRLVSRKPGSKGAVN